MDSEGIPIAPSLSAQQTIALWASSKANVGVWAPDFQTLAPLTLSDGTQNASASYDFVCGSGTYQLDFTHLLGPDRGIYTIDIDGTTIGTLDGYAASFHTVGSTGLADATMTTFTGIGLTASAHVLRFTMAAKNASASAYKGCLSVAVLTRKA